MYLIKPNNVALAKLLRHALLLVLLLVSVSARPESGGEYCYQEKCWQFQSVSNVRVGGMNLDDGKYVRSDNMNREANGEKTTSKRIATLVFSGDMVDVDIFSFDHGPKPSKISFSFGYDLATSSVLAEKTVIDELIGVNEESVLRSIPDIADDMLKNHGLFSSGESVNFSRSLSIRGTPLVASHTLTVLGATRYQGEDYILLRSEYAIELDSVTAKAEGYLMQDAITSMPRHSGHLVTMKVGDQETMMESSGYVSILAQ